MLPLFLLVCGMECVADVLDLADAAHEHGCANAANESSTRRLFGLADNLSLDLGV